MNNNMDTTYTVSLESVSKQYQTKSHEPIKALNNINLSITAGEVLGLFGHNGAGKSTMMKLILGLMSPSRGEVRAFGCNPASNHTQDYRQQFGYLPENVSFYDHLSGYEALLYFARLKGHNKYEVEKKLSLVELSLHAKRPIKTYSKGMRQRLGLAQALLGTPKLLLLDEPTVGLDPLATEDFYHIIDELKAQGCSVILCSHVLPGVEKHIDRAMMIQHGKQLCLGELKTLGEQAKIPTEITITGLTEKQCRQEIEKIIPKTNWRESGISLDAMAEPKIVVYVSEEYKLPLLSALSSLPTVEDIDIKKPALSDIYRFFQSQESSEQNEDQNVIDETVAKTRTVEVNVYG